MIVINNPNNPTGTTIPKTLLREIVEFARERGIIVLADEVYSPLYHSLPHGQDPPPSILSFGYDKTVATGSMSKAYALAGIRLGWIASRDRSIIDLALTARDYTTISVSQLDDQVASYALSDAVLPSLMKRNLELARTNLGHLSAFVDKYSSVCSWTKPTAGTTALVQFKKRRARRGRGLRARGPSKDQGALPTRISLLRRREGFQGIRKNRLWSAIQTS